MATNSSFREAIEASKATERRVELWLQRHGWATLACYEFSGIADDKPPILGTLDKDICVPDILGFRDTGLIEWWEVKLKTAASLHRRSGVLETGMSARHWFDYSLVEATTRRPVNLLFIHEEENTVWHATIAGLNHIGPRVSDSKAMGSMVFFPVEAMKKVATAKEILCGP